MHCRLAPYRGKPASLFGKCKCQKSLVHFTGGSIRALARKQSTRLIQCLTAPKAIRARQRPNSARKARLIEQTAPASLLKVLAWVRRREGRTRRPTRFQTAL
jgi:hypothetical protein